ncbi:hypothetical protein AL755_10905 [Arthrobacter sp. ERGS1:01]|nr:hypothetical protein AL755_10905 [Arthrobacter sp. ERGS1:01]
MRWMPAAAVPVVIAAVVLAAPLQAAAPVKLPAKTAEQLVALVAGNDVNALSGTLEQTVALGLPQLPDVGSGKSQAPSSSGGTGTSITDLVGLLTAPHTARIYLDGSANERVQILDTLAERDVVRHGNTVWTYDSATNSATMLTLAAGEVPYATAPHMVHPGAAGTDTTPKATPVPSAGANPLTPAQLTPAQLAAKFLANLDPSTEVSVGPNTRVAGRSAYDLVLAPRTTATLVGKVSIAVDAATGLPLKVTVQARGSDAAAFQVAFSQITLAAPPASTFNFSPPAGAVITRQTLPATGPVAKGEMKKLPGILPAPGTTPAAPAPPKLTTTGTGWSAIVEAPAGTVPSNLATSPQLAELLQSVPGGHALETTLFTALITPDGRLYAGAVPLAALQAAAAGK